MSSLLQSCPLVAHRWWFFLCESSLNCWGELILAVHAFTAATIQAMILLRKPDCILAAEVKNDFASSCQVIEAMGPASPVARRAIPVLRRLRERIEVPAPAYGQGTSTASWEAFSGFVDSSYRDRADGTRLDPSSSNASAGHEALPRQDEHGSHLSGLTVEGDVFDSIGGAWPQNPADILLGEHADLSAQYSDPVLQASMDPLLETLCVPLLGHDRAHLSASIGAHQTAVQAAAIARCPVCEAGSEAWQQSRHAYPKTTAV